MTPARFTSDELRQRLVDKIRRWSDNMIVLRGGSQGTPGLGMGVDQTIQDAIIGARRDRYISNQIEQWLEQASQARSIDDIVVTLESNPVWSNDLPLSQLPPLTPEEDRLARAEVAAGEEPMFPDDVPELSWAEATGRNEPGPAEWTPRPHDPPATAAQPIEPARGRASRGSGLQSGEEPPDPNDTANGTPGERRSGGAQSGELGPSTVKDGGPPVPVERSGPSTIKTGLEAAGAAATVAAAAKRGWSAIRILRFGAGGILIFVLAYGGWRLWGYATGPGAGPGSSSPPAAAGQLEALNAEAELQEKASTYVTTPFTTAVTVFAGRFPGLSGSVDVTLEGETEFETTYDCYAQPPGSVSGAPRTLFVERKPIMVRLAYEKIQVSTKDVGTYDEGAGTFSMPIKPRIVRSFYLLLQKFTDSRCLHYNDVGPQPDWTDQFFGTGTVEGSVSFGSGSATVHTRWEWGNGIKVEGQTTLTGKVERS